MTVECLDERYSTTRRVTRDTPPVFANRSTDVFLPPHPQRKGEGGLRKKGIFKSASSDYPLVSVITVVFNNHEALEDTISSVLTQKYSNIEYIVIDGGSTDGTLDVIKRHEGAIDYWVSEPDSGIYGAMNKGIRAASGQWLNFMNAKDTFADKATIQTLADKYLGNGFRFFYSDVLLVKQGRAEKKPYLYKCDHKQLVLNHQAAIYTKELHEEYGPYAVSKGLTISDYLFFSLLKKSAYYKVDEPIARYDITGASQSMKAVQQKFVIDFLLNSMPTYKFLAYFSLYYYFRKIREAITHR